MPIADIGHSPMAAEVVAWLAVPPALRWLDVGCGTGTLAESIPPGDGLIDVVTSGLVLRFTAEPVVARAEIAGSP